MLKIKDSLNLEELEKDEFEINGIHTQYGTYVFCSKKSQNSGYLLICCDTMIIEECSDIDLIYDLTNKGA